MRKLVGLYLVLMANAAFAQITSGSTVIINFTQDQLIVAADSRGIGVATDSRGVEANTRIPNNSECKIATFGKQLVFASVGNVRYASINPLIFTPLADWDDAKVAHNLSRPFWTMPADEFFIEAIARRWADAIASNWRLFYRLHPAQVDRLARKGEDALTMGIFLEGAKSAFSYRVGAIKFDRANASVTPIIEEVGHLSACSECGEGNRICAAGVHLDFVAKFCSELKANSCIHVRTALKDATQHTRLAVEIVEKMIDTYDKTVGDVGGSVDALTIGGDGSITWNARKDNCPENQN